MMHCIMYLADRLPCGTTLKIRPYAHGLRTRTKRECVVTPESLRNLKMIHGAHFRGHLHLKISNFKMQYLQNFARIDKIS